MHTDTVITLNHASAVVHKLHAYTLMKPGVCTLSNLLDTLPVIVSHLHLLAQKHSKPDSKSVAKQHVQDNRIPPALLKVG